MEKLYEYILRICRDHKIKITLLPSEYIDSAHGYFDSTNKEICICFGNKKQYTKLLLHEFCHALQFIEEIPIYTDTYKYSYIYNEPENWHKYTQKQLREVFQSHKLMEVDCERRVLDAIKEFGLNIDIKQYCREANIDIYTYDILHITKSSIFPKATEELLSIMPDNFNREYKKIPSNIKKELLKHYEM